jgi:hypothetical protein
MEFDKERTSRVQGGIEMRRGLWIGVTLLVIAAGILVGVGAYHAGVNDGIDQAARSDQIVRVVGGHYGGFPFGILIFPLVIFGIFAIAGAKRRRWAAMGPGGGPGHWGGPGRWGNDRQSVEEFHRRLNEADAGDGPSSGGEPAQRA